MGQPIIIFSQKKFDNTGMLNIKIINSHTFLATSQLSYNCKIRRKNSLVIKHDKIFRKFNMIFY